MSRIDQRRENALYKKGRDSTVREQWKSAYHIFEREIYGTNTNCVWSLCPFLQELKIIVNMHTIKSSFTIKSVIIEWVWKKK